MDGDGNGGAMTTTNVTSPGRSAAYRRAERVIAWVLPSLGDALFVCVLLGVVLGLRGAALGVDGDAGWNLRIGQQILAHGLPRTEFMLFPTSGRPVVYWEWLAQVVYGLAYRAAGLPGVVASAGLLVAGVSAGLYVALRRRGVPLLLALALAFAGVGLTSITWTARAQLFSLALTLWSSEALWRYWRSGDPRRLWVFPPLLALWANLHGGFLGGLLLLMTATVVAWLFPSGRAEANPRHLTFALAASFGATFVNPWGLGLYGHILTYFGNPLVARYTQEYQSPDFHTLAGLLFLVLVLALVAAWMWSRRPEPLAVAEVALWTALAFVSVRFVPLWALICLPILGESLAGPGRSRAPETPAPLARFAGRASAALGRVSRRLEAADAQVGRGLWTALGIVAVVLLLARANGTQTGPVLAQFDGRALPVEAAARLRAAGVPAGPGYAPYEWGGYLDFALPAYHPFIDSRSDAYDESLLRDYAAINALSPGWRAVFDKYGFHWALLPAGSPLEQVLAISPGWQCRAADGADVAMLCLQGGSAGG